MRSVGLERLEFARLTRNVAGNWGKGQVVVYDNVDIEEFVRRSVISKHRYRLDNNPVLIDCQMVESYSLRSHGWRVVNAFRKIGPEPYLFQIRDFVRRFGPLVNFGRWVSPDEPIEIRSLERAEQYEELDEDEPPVDADDAFTKDKDGYLPGNDLPDLGDRTDVDDFSSWLAEIGRSKDAKYVLSARNKSVATLPDRRVTLPEPILFYRWAYQRLTDVVDEINLNGQLTGRTRTWLNARLQEIRYGVVAPGNVVAVATTLLAYITASIVNDWIDDRRAIRSCPVCSKQFLAGGKKRFCSDRCAGTDRVRRFRKRTTRR